MSAHALRRRMLESIHARFLEELETQGIPHHVAIDALVLCDGDPLRLLAEIDFIGYNPMSMIHGPAEACTRLLTHLRKKGAQL